jgi:hypothetical protein
MGLRWRLVACAAAGLLVLAGCGGDGGGGGGESKGATATTAGKGAEPAKLDLAAVGKEGCTKVQSGRVKVTMTVSGEGVPEGAAATLSGAFDNKARRSHHVMDFGKLISALGAATGETAPPGLAEGLAQMEVVVDGDTTYVKSGFFGALFGGGGAKPWIKFTKGQEGADSFSTDTLFGTDFCEVSQVLTGVIGNVEKVGTEDVDGTRTTHFRATVDLAKAAEAAGTSAEGLKELMGSVGTKEVPIEVWVDGDGVVRRVQLSFSDFDLTGVAAGAAGGAGGAGEAPKKVSATFRIDITDVNKPVKIDLPPADQVAEAGNLFGTPPTTPSG